MSNTAAINASIERIADYLVAADARLITAESCTGGLLASTLTSRPGSSAWFEGSFVTYRLSAKTRMLDIPAAELEHHGAVSEHIARRMAEQALNNSDAQISIAITGLAGPQGDGTSATVGTLWIAWASHATDPKNNWLHAQYFDIHASRERFRQAAIVHALDGLWQRLRQHQIG